MKPDFIHENFEWYLDKNYTEYALTKNVDNLPALKNVGCFQVKDAVSNLKTYVMIDNNQNILADCKELDAFVCKINILKIAKHYDESETICKQKSRRFVRS